MTHEWRLKRQKVHTRLRLGHSGKSATVPARENDLKENILSCKLSLSGRFQTKLSLGLFPRVTFIDGPLHTYLGLSVHAPTGVSFPHPHGCEGIILNLPLLPDPTHTHIIINKFFFTILIRSVCVCVYPSIPL